MAPGSMDRLTLSVVNQLAPPVTRVELTVPEIVTVLGVGTPAGWEFDLERATDSTPQRIVWTGDAIPRWGLAEYPVFGRLAADADDKVLIFPVRVTRGDGSSVEWSRSHPEAGRPPTIRIVGSTTLTGWGTIVLSGLAIGLSALALAFALTRDRRTASG